MDIFKFINSRDIREYLKQIKYEFTPQQMAWLIYYSNKTTLQEKYDAWNELIETTPDCEANTIPYYGEAKSLHTLLKKHITLSKKYVDKYFNLNEENGDPHFYKVRSWEAPRDDDSEYGEETLVGYYASYKDACDAIKEELVETYNDTSDYQMLYANIDRIYLGSDGGSYISVDLDKELNITSAYFPASTEEEDFILFGAFDGQWHPFPTPFKKGDIICDSRHMEGGICCGPFVTTGVGLDCLSEEVKERFLSRKRGDYTDMTAGGYFQYDSGKIYNETVWNYMDFEYYRGELDGNQRILKALSNAFKGKINAAEFGMAYHAILTDGNVEQLKNMYVDEWLVNMGLEGEDDE